jgi:isoleucyl-tRNA synthetase
LQRHASGLKEILNVSRVEIIAKKLEDEDIVLGPIGIPWKSINISTQPATGHKCARCWNFMPVVSNYGIWQNVCTRCQDALKEMKIAPPVAT